MTSRIQFIKPKVCTTLRTAESFEIVYTLHNISSLIISVSLYGFSGNFIKNKVLTMRGYEFQNWNHDDNEYLYNWIERNI